MKLQKNTVLFSLIFIYVFVCLDKNSNIKGVKKFLFVFKPSSLFVFAQMEPAVAKNNNTVFSAENAL